MTTKKIRKATKKASTKKTSSASLHEHDSESENESGHNLLLTSALNQLLKKSPLVSSLGEKGQGLIKDIVQLPQWTMQLKKTLESAIKDETKKIIEKMDVSKVVQSLLENYELDVKAHITFKKKKTKTQKD